VCGHFRVFSSDQRFFFFRQCRSSSIALLLKICRSLVYCVRMSISHKHKCNIRLFATAFVHTHTHTHTHTNIITYSMTQFRGHAVAQLVDALRYKPEVCGFDSRWCNWNFSLAMHRQFNIQKLYALPTLYLRVLYFSENKQRLVPLTA